MNSYITYFSACIAIFASTTSGSPANDTLSLSNAIKQSLQNNTLCHISRKKVDESRYKIRETWGKLWPELNTEASGTKVWADKGINSLVDRQYNISFIKGNISVNPGEFYNNLKSSRENYIIAVNEERRVEADTVIRTIQLYYQMLLASEIVQLRNDSLKALEENQQAVSAGYNSGVYTKLDFLRARVAAANEKTKLIIAEHNYEGLRNSMNIHIGNDLDAQLILDREAIHTDIKEAESFATWSAGNKKENLQAMLEKAMTNRPELIQIRARKETALANAAANEAVYLWPTLFAAGNYGVSKIIQKSGAGSSTGDTQIDAILRMLNESSLPSGWNKNWSITIGAAYRWGALSPLDPANARSNGFRSMADQADLAMEEFIKETEMEIQQGLLKIIAASHAILSQHENISLAEESVHVAAVQFKSGTIDNTKLLDANVEFASAKTLYYQSLYDFQTAKAEINRAMGYEFFNFSNLKDDVP